MKKVIFFLMVWGAVGVGCTGSDPIENLIVASEQANCTGVAPQKCLLIKQTEEDSWEFWYSGINGFDYEPGYEYVIRVRRKKIENPPADASSIQYELVKIISKTQKQSEGMPSMPLQPME